MINQPSNLSHKPMTIPLAHQPIIVTLSHQPITITLSLIYHHQTTITRSSHMDTKIITKPCTSTISHVHQPCTIPCINHVHQPVPYHVSTMHRPCTKTYTIPRTSTCTIPCTSTMYQTCTVSCINHVPYQVNKPFTISRTLTMHKICTFSWKNCWTIGLDSWLSLMSTLRDWCQPLEKSRSPIDVVELCWYWWWLLFIGGVVDISKFDVCIW